jgi:hypothetical protein
MGEAWPTSRVPWGAGCERHAENSKCVGCKVQVHGAGQNKLWAQGVAGQCLHAPSSRKKRGPSTRSTAKIDPAPSGAVQGIDSGPELAPGPFGELAHSSSGTPLLGPRVAACGCRQSMGRMMAMEWVGGSNPRRSRRVAAGCVILTGLLTGGRASTVRHYHNGSVVLWHIGGCASNETCGALPVRKERGPKQSSASDPTPSLAPNNSNHLRLG